jgi:hypothetical protein
MIEKLLQMGGIDMINHVDSNGWSALHFTAAFGKPEEALVRRSTQIYDMLVCYHVVDICTYM